MSSDIFQENIFRRLREGAGDVSKEDFFISTVERELARTAKKYGCEIEVSPQRLAQAQANWISDLEGVEGRRLQGERDQHPPPTADAIKHAAFLCYWLRRRLVVEYVWDTEEHEDAELQKGLVALFGCEFFALSLAFRLCLFGEFVTRGHKPEESARRVQEHSPDPNLLRELAVLLYHKNVSPHAIYLIFKGMLWGPGRAAFAPNVVTLGTRPRSVPQ